MSDAVELAVAYVQVVTSLQGSQGKLAEELIPELGGAGDKAAQGFGDKFKSGLGKIDAGKATLGLGAGLVAGFTGLYQVGATFDDLADTIRVDTGASGAALDGLVGVAESVGARVPAEFDKIGPTIADLNQRLGLSGDTLETVASQYLEAGRVLGEDVDVRKTSAAFSAFGIEGKGVEGAMDSLFRVSQSTGVGMNELASITARSAPQMKQLGFSFEETASLAGTLDKAGLNAKATMAAMGKGLVTLAKDGEEPQAAFQRVTGEIGALVEKGDEAGALNLAAKLFGTKGAPQFIDALKKGVIGTGDLAAAATSGSDTILGVADETADFAESWQLVQNNAQLALEPLASTVFSALASTLQGAMPSLTGFGAWLKDNQWVLGVVIGLIGVGLVGAFIAWTASIWAATIALLANPVTWIIIGIIALVAALVWLVSNWDSVVAWVTDVWGAFVGWLAGVWDAIVAGVTAFGSQVGSFFTGLWNGLVATVVGFGGRVSSFLAGLWSGIVATVTGVWGRIVAFFAGIPGRVMSAIAGLGQLGARALAWFAEVYNAGTRKFGELISWVGGVPGRILSALGNVGRLLYNAGKSIISGFFSGLKAMWSNVTGWVSGIGSWIAAHKGPLSYDRGLLIPHGRAIIEGLDEGLNDRIDRVYATVGGVAGDIADTVVQGAVSVAHMEPVGPTTGVSAVSAAEGAGTTVNGPLVQVDSMQVRSEGDIRRVSQELASKIEAAKRAAGEPVLVGGSV